jgi:hypothetical protein
MIISNDHLKVGVGKKIAGRGEFFYQFAGRIPSAVINRENVLRICHGSIWSAPA